MTTINQKEYLKKYLRIGKAPGEKKKKKKKEKTLGNRLKIIDDDVDILMSQEIQDDLLAANEDAPQIVAIIDERPPSLQVDEKTKSSLWKPIGEPSNVPQNIEALKVNSFKLSKQVTSTDGKISVKKESVTKSYTKYMSSNDRNGSISNFKEENYVDLSSSSPQRYEDDYSPPRRLQRKDASPDKRKNRERSLSPRIKTESKDDSSPRRRNKEDSSPSRRRNKEENSPPRRRNNDRSLRRRNTEEDASPPRRRNKEEDSSPSGRRNREDNSPPRRNNREEDSSPSRRKNREEHRSPPRRRNKGEESSPSRRRNNEDNLPSRNRDREEDNSPLRRRIKEEDSSPPRRSNKGEDSSPPRRRNKEDDSSPPRKQNREKYTNVSSSTKRRNEDMDRSPLRKEKRKGERSKRTRWNSEEPPDASLKEKMSKTLDGKQAGLQKAKDLLKESKFLRQREDELFQNMSAEVSGRNATTVVRGKKTKYLEEEAAKAKREKEMKEKYDRWGKGLKQVEAQSKTVEEQLHEMSKPLARYADDEDLEKFLKEQERDGDPMLAYIRKKKKKEKVAAGIPEKPMYMGEFMPNRFGIQPGYRWDGVDRSSGYEKKWFQVQNAKKANREEAFKWSMEDM